MPAPSPPPFRIGLLVPCGAGARRHRIALEQAALAEAAGFDAVWLEAPPGGDAAAAVLLAAIAARTTRVRLGTAPVALAELDPLRVAEDGATLDGIAGGRLEWVAALPDSGSGDTGSGEETRARFAEHLALLRRLWSESAVTWSGRFRAPLAGVTVEPRPVQSPHPRVWARAGNALESVDLAAALGLPLVLPPLPTEGQLAARVTRYRERAAAAGHDPASLWIAACHRILQGTHEIRGSDSSDLLTSFGLSRGRTGELAERLRAARDRLGLDAQLLAFDGMDVSEEALGQTLARLAARADRPGGAGPLPCSPRGPRIASAPL